MRISRFEADAENDTAIDMTDATDSNVVRGVIGAGDISKYGVLGPEAERADFMFEATDSENWNRSNDIIFESDDGDAEQLAEGGLVPTLALDTSDTLELQIDPDLPDEVTVTLDHLEEPSFSYDPGVPLDLEPTCRSAGHSHFTVTANGIDIKVSVAW